MSCNPPQTHRYESDASGKRTCRRCGDVFPADADPPTPRTAAGRDLLTNGHWDEEEERLLLPGYVGVDDLKQDILAIEAEAAAPATSGLDVDVLAEASMRAAKSHRIDGRIPLLHQEWARDVAAEYDRLLASAPSQGDEG